jgi:hypothetical protein
MNECEQIRLNDLKGGRWYVGRGRNGNVGMWDGEHFLVIGKHCWPIGWVPREFECQPAIKVEKYFMEEEGCFQPFLLIDEGTTSTTIDTHYAKTLVFGTSSCHVLSKY